MMDLVTYVDTGEVSPDLVRDCLEAELILGEYFQNTVGGYTDMYTTPIATAHYQKYNVFNLPFSSLHTLKNRIASRFREIKPDDDYMIHGWLNVFRSSCPAVSYHEHNPASAGSYHGFYVVQSPVNKPTTYRYKDGTYNVVDSIEGRLVMSLSGYDQHQTTPVENDEVRITVAFNITPVAYLQTGSINLSQYIPL